MVTHLPNTLAAYRKGVPQLDKAIRRKDIINGIAVHNKVTFLPNLSMRLQPHIPPSMSPTYPMIAMLEPSCSVIGYGSSLANNVFIDGDAQPL